MVHNIIRDPCVFTSLVSDIKDIKDINYSDNLHHYVY